MKIKSENIYRIALFVPFLVFIDRYFILFRDIANGPETGSLYGMTDSSQFLSIPLIPYIFLVVILLLLSIGKSRKFIFRLYMFAPLLHGLLIGIWLSVLSIAGSPVEWSSEGTLFSLFVIGALGAIVAIPIGYLFVGFIAVLYLLLKKFRLIDEQYEGSIQ